MERPKIITVTLNPCIDKTVQVCAFRPGITNRVLSSREDVGGKGLNVSRVLRDCGEPVLTAGLAEPKICEAVRAALTDANMQALFFPTPSETRVNLKIIDTQTGCMTELNASGSAVGNAPESLTDTLLPLIDTAKVLVLSGSLPPDVDRAIYKDWIVYAKKRNVRVILDADHEAFQLGVEAAPYAVKPNLAELERWAGKELRDRASVRTQMEKLHDRGVSLVCVSMGADGALFSQGGTILHAVPFPVSVGSPAAAGDAMVGMMAYGIVRDLPLPDIARLACAAGTCTAAKEGTQMASFAEILACFAQIQLQEENAI